MVNFRNDWDAVLAGEFDKPYYQQLRGFLAAEYRTHKIYPDMYAIFHALELTAFSDVKVVILGQDPYHGPNQAHGLAFSVQKGIDIPPSLMNMFSELHSDCGCYIPNNGFLEKWARQGVLLLNASLTVRAGEANSHRNKGWELFTSRIIQLLNDRPALAEAHDEGGAFTLFDAPPSPQPPKAAVKNDKGIVFLLWGANAKEKAALITNPKHAVLVAPHPSPLSASRGFFGCRHFSRTNALLKDMGYSPVDWQIENI